MNLDKLFSKRPDGVGFGEDPGHLTGLYSGVEHWYMRRAIGEADLTGVWFPIGKRLSELPKGTRWQVGASMLELFRFGGSVLTGIALLEGEQASRVLHFFDAYIPEHLRSTLFGLPIKNETDRRTLFRKAVRVSWTLLNTSEVAPLVPDLETGELVPDLQVPAGKRFRVLDDLADIANRADYKIHNRLRDSRSAYEREKVLEDCIYSLNHATDMVIALLKIETPISDRRAI